LCQVFPKLGIGRDKSQHSPGVGLGTGRSDVP
jgi:hypothetical protein